MYSYARPTADAASIRRDRPLTNDEIFSAVPSVFADEAHSSRSDRYGFIPTISVLDGLRANGFEPFEARQTRVRDQSKKSFTRHLLRLRHPDAVTKAGVTPEIILLNSHDGSSGYQLLSGFFRFVCSNGLVAGDVCDDVRIQHRGRGNLVDNVIEGCARVLDNVQLAGERIEKYQAVQLTERQQSAFASAALTLKYDDPNTAPVTEHAILLPHRHEDRRQDLWTVFNVVQENLIKGGLRGRSASGRRVRTRAVTGVDQDVKLNKALWTLADRLAQAVAPDWFDADTLTADESRILEAAH